MRGLGELPVARRRLEPASAAAKRRPRRRSRARARRRGRAPPDRGARGRASAPGRRHDRRVAAGLDVAEPRADDEQHVGVAHALAERRVGAEPEVARVGGRVVVDVVLARQAAATGSPLASHQRRGRPGGLASTARRRRRRAAARRRRAARARARGRRRRACLRGDAGDASATSADLGEHVLRQGEHDRAGPPGGRDPERPRHQLRDPLGLVDLRDPLRHRAEHLRGSRAPGTPPGPTSPRAIWPTSSINGVESWEAVWTPHRRLRRARPARDHADARPAGELAVRLRHVRGAHLVAAGDEADRGVVERVEHGEVALARNAEGEVDPVQRELVDEDPAAAAAHRGSAIACSSRIAAVCFGAVLVGRIDVADRALARPLRGQHQHADERGLEVGRGAREHGLGPALEPGAAGAVERASAPRSRSRARRGAGSGSRPGMRVQVGDAAEREVDAVAADDPLGERVELDVRESERALRLASSWSSCQTSAAPSTTAAPKCASPRSRS